MAGAGGDRNQSLKETIYESLTAILSADHVTRSNGEDQIKALEVTEGEFSSEVTYTGHYHLPTTTMDNISMAVVQFVGWFV